MAIYKDPSSVTHNNVAIAEVTQVDVEQACTTIRHIAGANKHHTMVDAVDWTTVIRVHTKDLAKTSSGIARGLKATLVVVAVSGDGGSNKTLTFSNAVYCGSSSSPQHGSFENGGVLNFEAYSSDGTTEPLAVT